MNTKKILLAATIQSILCATPVFAGDVEVSLPTGADAFTVDQPAGTELMRINGDGNVGIGTATPSRTLDIVDATAAENDAAVWITQNASSEHTLTVSGSNVLTQNTGLYLRTQKVGTIKTGDGAELRLGAGNRTDYLNILPNGNIGIGTTTPSNGTANGGKVLKLDVEGAIGASSYCDENGENCKTILQLGGSSADNLGNHTATQNIDLAANKLVGNGGTEGIAIAATGNVGIGTTAPTAALQVVKADADNYVARLANTAATAGDSWGLKINAGSAAGDSALDVYSANGNSLFMRVQGDGNVGIGTTLPTEKLHVYGGVMFEGLAAGSTGNYLCRDTSGVVTHGGSCSTSDERLKKDIAPVADALDKVQQMQGVTYHWKDESRGTRTELGLIAQEVEKVIPEVVDTASDTMGTKSIRYENLVAVLIEGMKEQQAQIEAQQQRIDALEAKLK